MRVHFQGGPLGMYIEDISEDKLSDIMVLRFYNKIHTYKKLNTNYYNYVKTERVKV